MPPLYEGRRGSRLQREKMEPGGSETGLAPAVGGGVLCLTAGGPPQAGDNSLLQKSRGGRDGGHREVQL